MSLKKFFSEYLCMNRMQQSGTIVLIFLIIAVSAVPRFVAYYRANRSMPDFAKFDSIIASYEALELPKEIPATIRTDTVFTFDPNTATYEDFLCLGLSEKISSNIIKYRESGGSFRKSDDFARIYGINDSIYSRLKPYININIVEKPARTPKKQPSPKQTDNKKKKPADSVYVSRELAIVELNSADSAQLVALRGIGSVLARRIMTYRDMLGGFYSVEQLREVRNLPPETYANLYQQFAIDTSAIVRINLNDFKYKQLSGHPYMSVTQLNAIMNYKKIMGKFKSVDDLLRFKLVDTVTYEKIAPYLESR